MDKSCQGATALFDYSKAVSAFHILNKGWAQTIDENLYVEKVLLSVVGENCR